MVLYFIYLLIWTAGPLLEASNADNIGVGSSTCLRNNRNSSANKLGSASGDGGSGFGDLAQAEDGATNLLAGLASLWGGGADYDITPAQMNARRTEIVLDWAGIFFVVYYILIEVFEYWSKNRRMILFAARSRNIVEHGEAQYLLLSPADYHNRISSVKKTGSSLLGVRIYACCLCTIPLTDELNSTTSRIRTSPTLAPPPPS